MTNIATEAPGVVSGRHDTVEHAKRVAKNLSPKDVAAVRKLKAQNVPEPRRVLMAAKKSKLPLSFAAALVLEERELLHGATLVSDFSKLSVFMRKLGAHDGAAAYRRGQPDAAAFADRFVKRQDQLAVALGEKPPTPAKIVLNPRNWWKKFVVGDTDCDRDLLTALANVAKDLNTTIYVRQGRRTIAEQQHLYDLFLAGKGNLAARPNKNAPHVRGIAADCAVGTSRDGSNIGDYKGARDAMKKRGLCLCVGGETWHVQRGDNWLA
jgi:hypothetical protein